MYTNSNNNARLSLLKLVAMIGSCHTIQPLGLTATNKGNSLAFIGSPEYARKSGLIKELAGKLYGVGNPCYGQVLEPAKRLYHGRLPILPKAAPTNYARGLKCTKATPIGRDAASVEQGGPLVEGDDSNNE